MPAVLAGAAAVWVIAPTEATNAAKYKRIRLGMRLEEVQRLMGSPGVYWNEFEDEHGSARGGVANNGLDDDIKRPVNVIHFHPPPLKIPYWEWEGRFDWAKEEIRGGDRLTVRCWLDQSAGVAVRIDEDGFVTDKLLQLEERPRGVCETVVGWFGTLLDRIW